MTRDELRSFLNLGARAVADGVPTDDVERQEDTVLRSLALLDEKPGVVLADEVGMGKTFEALGVVAAVRRNCPNATIVILTPGPDLNTKWEKELARFGAGNPCVHSFGESYIAVRWLSELVRALQTHKIIVAPINIFEGSRERKTQAHLLSLFFHWKKVHANTANAILQRFRDGAVGRIDVRAARFLDHATYEQLKPHLERAFTSGTEEAKSLDEIYSKFGLAGFENDHLVKKALNTARFRLVHALLPEIELIVLDEAHKLKNAETVRSQAVMEVFSGRFRKALFLTATPFQLDVSELRQVFRFFSIASTAPSDLMASIDGLFANIREYQEAYASFEKAWQHVDVEGAEAFTRLYTEDPELRTASDDVSVKTITGLVKRLFDLKCNRIEPAFRSWMIRSLREDKRQYRKHIQHRQVPDATSLPFLLYERFLSELFHQGQQTHKASVEINMVSSYGAAQEGALLASAEGGERFKGDLEIYRRLLRAILEDLRKDNTDHPKMRFVLKDALDAAERGEKTLVFCTRIATLTDLSRDIRNEWRARLVKRWQAVYPNETAADLLGGSANDDATTITDPSDDDFDPESSPTIRTRGRHEELQRRFHTGYDALYLALRESYVHSLFHLDQWPLEHLAEIITSANELLKTVQTTKTSAQRLDYQIAKRCLEQATAVLWRDSEEEGPNDHAEALAQITHKHFIPFGLDLIKDELEEGRGTKNATETPTWTISEDTARAILSPRPNLWQFTTSHLESLSFPIRVKMVERLARFLTYREVPFLADLLAAAKAATLDIGTIESRALLGFIDKYWQSDGGRAWVSRIKKFLAYFCDRDPGEQTEILDGPIATGQLVRQTRDGESRERLREAFNTPLYPMILIANEVMQEGLDLHRNCRRIIHHDLAWNPAQLEQRVGRIDRLGSLTLQLRKRDTNASLDVLYPLIEGTIDQRMYRMVKTREKWLEFLLGALPTSELAVGEVLAPPLPDGLAASLRIDLRPGEAP